MNTGRHQITPTRLTAVAGLIITAVALTGCRTNHSSSGACATTTAFEPLVDLYRAAKRYEAVEAMGLIVAPVMGSYQSATDRELGGKLLLRDFRAAMALAEDAYLRFPDPNFPQGELRRAAETVKAYEKAYKAFEQAKFRAQLALVLADKEKLAEFERYTKEGQENLASAEALYFGRPPVKVEPQAGERHDDTSK